jgi:hypothetical protein
MSIALPLVTAPFLSLLLLGACATRPSTLPRGDYQILVKSVRLPERNWLPWYTRFAEHVWVEIADAQGRERIEWNRGFDAVVHTELDTNDLTGDATADERWDRSVAVLARWTGGNAVALATRIRAVADDFPNAADYRAWPGPNYNTFIAWLAREASFGIELPANAVGKDYAGWLAAGVSTTGLGLHLDTAVLGVQAGLVEGVELHLLGLTAGVGLWPPSLKLPFLPAIPGGWFGI